MEKILYKECEYLENKFYKVTINEDGSFNVLDKESQKEYKNQGVLCRKWR